MLTAVLATDYWSGAPIVRLVDGTGLVVRVLYAEEARALGFALLELSMAAGVEA